MYKKIIISALSASLLLAVSQVSMATTPDKCPTVDALKSAFLVKFNRETNGTWTADAVDSNYDTNAVWQFAITDIDGDRDETAVANAKKAMSSLHYGAGPIHFIDSFYVCMYYNDMGYRAFAGTGGVGNDDDLKAAMKNFSK